jgi:hypothetical protein
MSADPLDLAAIDAALARFDDDGGVEDGPWFDLAETSAGPEHDALNARHHVPRGVRRRVSANRRRRPREEWARPSDLPEMHVPPGYRRDPRGTWRYDADGDAVPGARDLTLDTLWAFGRRRPVVVPDAVVRVAPELAWCRRCGDADDVVQRTGAAALVWVVDEIDWDERAEWPLGLDAPELVPGRLVDVEALAALVSVAPSTVTAYLARGQLPEPQVRIGGRPAWSRAVLARWWMRSRRSSRR